MAERVTYAVTRGDDPVVFIAEDDEVMSRVLALHLVAKTPARSIRDQAARSAIQAALLAEDWPTAVVEWMNATDTVVDVFPDEPVWSAEVVEEEFTSLELRVSPIFED